MTEPSIPQELFAWIDRALAQSLQANPVAYHFNLYEAPDSVHVQLTGTETFDAGTEYWPGVEIFSTGEDVFEVPLEFAGTDWREWLETLKGLVSSYIESGEASYALQRSQGVGLGFVDGDMHLVWQREAV